MRRTIFLLGCLLVWVPLVALGQADGGRPATVAADPELERRVSELLRRLDTNDYAARVAATAAIEDLPAESLPLLEAALAGGTLSPEVSVRIEMRIGLLRRKAGATRYQRVLKEEFDWNAADTQRCYDGGGHTNAKWDAAAREALGLYVRPRVDPNRSPKDDQRILAAFEKALALGCDDPFVLYAYANRYRLAPEHDRERAAALMDQAAEGVVAGNYPAMRKLMALARRAALTAELDGSPLSAGARRDVARDLDRALALLPEAAAQTPPRAMVWDATVALYQGYRTLLRNGDAAFAKVHPVLKAATPGRNVSLLVESSHHLSAAGALKEGTVASVRQLDPARKSTLLEKHRAAAKAAIDAAIAMDANDPNPLNDMLVYLNNVGAEPAEYERWFERAMAVDPGNVRACELKLAYLKRNADDAAQVAFGRECLAGKDWGSRIPILLVTVRARQSRFDRPGEAFGKPEVWADVRAVYDEYLKRYPNAVTDRSYYAIYACFAGQWAFAKAQFDRLGNEWDPVVFLGKQTYEYYRRKAERMAASGGR